VTVPRSAELDIEAGKAKLHEFLDSLERSA